MCAYAKKHIKLSIFFLGKNFKKKLEKNFVVRLILYIPYILRGGAICLILSYLQLFDTQIFRHKKTPIQAYRCVKRSLYSTTGVKRVTARAPQRLTSQPFQELERQPAL